MQPLRKVGDPRVETISVELTDVDVAEQQQQVCRFRELQAAVKEAKKKAMADYRARLQELESDEAAALRQVTTKHRDVDVTVQDYLSAANEVVTMRVDTHDVIRRRTATGEELQEELPIDPDDGGFGSGTH
jgi:hypothetical protein